MPWRTSCAELYPVLLESRKVRTNRSIDDPTGIGRARLIAEPLLFKQSDSRLSASEPVATNVRLRIFGRTPRRHLSAEALS